MNLQRCAVRLGIGPPQLDQSRGNAGAVRLRVLASSATPASSQLLTPRRTHDRRAADQVTRQLSLLRVA
jgi:hypothetical protein